MLLSSKRLTVEGKRMEKEREMGSEALAETGKNRQTPQPGIEPGTLSKRG